jgi:gliding motility-associated-like protein
LTVTARGGCTASDIVFVKVLKNPVIPNVFTPNGDGFNDKWIIKYLETYPGCVVEIYNRYGQIVFRSVGYNTPWDGTYKGNQVPAGTYYYIIDPKNGRKQVAGFVDIIR